MSYQKPHVSAGKSGNHHHHHRYGSSKNRCREEETVPNKQRNKFRKWFGDDHQGRIGREDRELIKHRLKEVETLKRKVRELQRALSNDVKRNKLESKSSSNILAESSSTISFLRGFSDKRRSNREDVIELYIKQNTHTDDALSTEVPFSSSLESISQHHKRHKPKKRDKHHYRFKEAIRAIKEVPWDDTADEKPVKLDKQLELDHFKSIAPVFPCTTSNWSHLTPKSVASVKDLRSDGWMVKNLSKKIDFQSNEIKEIKQQLKECLALLKEREDDDYRKQETSKKVPFGDDYVLVDRYLPKPNFNVYPNFLRSQKLINMRQSNNCDCPFNTNRPGDSPRNSLKDVKRSRSCGFKSKKGSASKIVQPKKKRRRLCFRLKRKKKPEAVCSTEKGFVALNDRPGFAEPLCGSPTGSDTFEKVSWRERPKPTRKGSVETTRTGSCCGRRCGKKGSTTCPGMDAGETHCVDGPCPKPAPTCECRKRRPCCCIRLLRFLLCSTQ